MSEWCQNKKCAEKKTQSQIRGSKGAKYYQSNKAKHYYFHMFCGQRCMDQWFNEHWQTCLNAVGEIDKQVVPLEDAWYVEYRYGWNVDELMIQIKTKHLDKPDIYADLHKLNARIDEVQKLVDISINIIYKYRYY